ncbi:MAG: type II toxin-antitoxin system RelE family toxin [Candidatus Nitrospinota bacterium M3_3B_026]
MRAQEDLRGLDKTAARRIINKVSGHLVKDPFNLSAALKGNLHGLYRYRVGDYRVIFAADQSARTLQVLWVGHRRSIYSSRK